MVDVLFEAFAWFGRANVVAQFGAVAILLDIPPGGAFLPAIVGGVGVVIGDAFAAVVEIFGLNRIPDIEGRPLERCLSRAAAATTATTARAVAEEFSQADVHWFGASRVISA